MTNYDTPVARLFATSVISFLTDRLARAEIGLSTNVAVSKINESDAQ